ncbi:MAG: MBL fold metallo-hydrolase [bacterium]|nr:MBL fold metallo-hydrolase [bacterium]
MINTTIETPNFKIHRVDGYINTIHILEYDSGLLCIDPGVSSDAALVESYCRSIPGRSPRDIRLTVVSHMHPDHSGGAVALRKKFGIPIAAHSLVDRWYAGFSGYFQYALDCFMTVNVALRQRKKIRNVCFKRIIKPDFLLNDIDAIPFFEDWQVRHIPGHTNHDIVLHNEQNKILYAADSVINRKGALTLPLPILFKSKMKQSYERLAGIPVSTILLAHGDIITTENPASLFLHMKDLFNTPPSRLSKQVRYLSFYSPEVWKPYLKKRLGKAA